MTRTDASRGDSVLAVDKASEREPPSRSIPDPAVTPHPVIGEAPLASAPSEEPSVRALRDGIRNDPRLYAAYTQGRIESRLEIDRLESSLHSERLARETAERRLALALMELGDVPDPRAMAEAADVRELERGENRPFSPLDPRPLTLDEVRAAVAAPHPETRNG